jgi:hypothetical protein
VLGRKTYTAEEIRRGRELVETQLAAFRAVTDAGTAGAAGAAGTADEATRDATRDALAELEERTAVAALLVLDRAFVHRLRAVEGNDTNPLTEVGLIATSLVEHDGVLTAVKGIKYLPGSSVLGIAPGERIRPGLGDAEKLTRAFLAELEARFLDA